LNGAESLVRSLVASGVEVCFSNPGTSEMHFIAALDAVPGMRPVLCLFEGVATGAADGYARVTGRPAATLLHLGPGLANAASNLHNARRAASPIVNIVGDHATYHAQYDSPLASDIAGIARPFSAWVHSSNSAKAVGADAARTVQAARAAPGQVATLILPADTAWLEADAVAPALPVAGPSPVPADAIAQVARVLRGGGRTAILMRDRAALTKAGLDQAGRIREATGCRLMCDTFTPRLERGAGVVAVERLPYFAEVNADFLKDLDAVILVGARPPTGFFAYPGKASWCLPEACAIHYLAHPHEDALGALTALADSLGAPPEPTERVPLSLPPAADAKFNAFAIGQVIARHLPEGALVSDDANTSSAGALAALATGRAHVHMPTTGGSIGQGLPLAVGAAVGAPEARVLCLSGGGSGLYMPQSLWTMARESLDITVVVFANRSYKILSVELGRVGVAEPGAKAQAMLSLTNPQIDMVSIAQGFGVPASRATTTAEFEEQFAGAMATRGPRLIEAVL
jgi:acetolactate synthase I/II/III large subunit